MRGWIEVHCLDRKSPDGNQHLTRSFNVANLRWIAKDNKGRGCGAVSACGDDFISVTKETYEELKALIGLAESV